MADEDPRALEDKMPDDAQDASGETPRSRDLSLAGRASCLTFVFLALVALTTFLVFYFNPNNISGSWGWPRIAIVTALVLVIPFVVFRAITLWLMGESSRYPDIDYAWRAGVAALGQHGMSLNAAPIFLIIGAASERERRNVMSATGYEFRVAGVPNGPAPLHWYANAQGIYIVINDACWTFEACRLARKSRRSQPAVAGGGEDAGGFAGTIAPGTYDFSKRAPSLGAEQGESRQEQEDEPAGRKISDEPRVDHAMLRGTLVPTSPASASLAPSRAEPASKGGRVTSRRSRQLLARLQHVCHLIRHARNNVCPINGILALLPFEVLEGPKQDVEELQRAVAADLSTAQRELQLRCPVTSVVTGMEQERGFREMMRRVGRERAARQRFGKSFNLRIEPTVEELTKFAHHVSGAFEDWVYAVFGEKDALARPGNIQLYALLCKVRGSIRTRLGEVLAAGFGYNAKTKDVDRARVFFSGCYFAATGATADRQAFMRGLLDKLRGEQEEVEWTEEAISENRRRRWLARTGILINFVLVLLIGAWFVYTRFVAPSS